MPALARTDIQTSLRMPKALYEQLSAAAEANGHGVGEEMRQRLAASFAGEPPATFDTKTRDLLVAVARAAALLNSWFGHWSEDPAVFRAFFRAITSVLLMRAGYKKDEPIPPLHPKPGSQAIALFGDKPDIDRVASGVAIFVLADELDEGAC